MQFCVILGISFIGEGLRYLIPLEIPASIYGLVILFIALQTKLIPLSRVRETGYFLIEIMPLMFIPAAVELLEIWPDFKNEAAIIGLIIFVSTFIVMIVSGHVTQFAVKLKSGGSDTGEVK